MRKTILLIFILFSSKNILAQDSLSLIFTGDIMGHESQLLSAKKGRNEFDYKPCFQYIKPLLLEADFTIGNLEVTLPGRKPYTGFMPLPIFRSPDSYADALNDAGFDILFNGNNHANDGMRRGVRHTIDKLDQLEIYHSGTFKNKKEREERYPLIVVKNGFTLAFLNYTFVGTNGIPTIKPSIINKSDTSQIKIDLEKAKKINPDFIIAFLHWGKEHSLEISAKQKEQTAFLLKNGVDMIVGMHPHVVQPIEIIEYQTSKHLIAYSLGNFISNHTMPNADGGIILKVLLKKDSNQKVEIAKAGYVPVWRYIDKIPKKSYFVIPIANYEQNPSNFPILNLTDDAALKSFAEIVRIRLNFPEWK